MANSEKLVRLLKIISLIENRQGASMKMLVQECEVSYRTIYRDIEALSQGGMPIFFDPDAGRYRFTEKVFLKPLTFSLDEAAALIQCSGAFVKDTMPMSQALQRAQERILASLPADRQRKVDELRSAIDIRVAQYPDQVCTDVFSCVEQAVSRRTRIQVIYYTKSTDIENERKLDPYLITYRGTAWYLVAYCHLRQAVKLFRVDRIRQISLLAETFDYPKNFSAAAFFEGSWVIEQGEPVQVRLRFNPEVARWLRGRQYHPSQHTTDEQDGSLIYEVTVTGTREITRWILGFGAAVEVLSPPELRRQVAENLRQAAAVYDKQADLPL